MIVNGLMIGAVIGLIAWTGIAIGAYLISKKENSNE